MAAVTRRPLFCLLAFCASFTIFDIADGFQHQQLQSQKHPFRSGISHGQRKSQPRLPSPISKDVTATPVPASSTQLEALPGLSASPLGSLAVLAGVVVIHECGHYLAARSFNITVEEFSVGFGPKLAGFEAFGNEFNLRALPLGGFVRFPENYDGEAAFEIDEKKRKALRTIRRERMAQRTNWNWKDEVLNSLTLGYWDERQIDEERNEKRLEREAAAAAPKPFWARFFGKKKKPKSENGDVDLEEVYEELDELESFEVEYFDDPQLLQNRPWPERALVLSGGVIFNILLAWSIYFAAIGPLPIGNNQGLPRAVFDNGVVVTQNPRSDGPSSGLLRQGDVITGINGA